MALPDTSLTPEKRQIEAVLEQLEDAQLAYVVARAHCVTDSEAYREASVSKSTFYRWDAEEREQLNAWAQQLKRAVEYRALRVLEDAAEDAANKLVEALKSRKETVQLKAAIEILDRVLSKPAQRHEVGGQVEHTQRIEIIEVVKTYSTEQPQAPHPEMAH